MVKKKSYLAAYDYGMGAVWAMISARDESEILHKYPMLKVMQQPPHWMTAEELDHIKDSPNSFDIDDSIPQWLSAATKE